jgi:DNA-binding CsgD family transcriptional regulator
MSSRAADASQGLVGEDLDTAHWEDARHWMAIYSDLLRFKVGLLQRVHREVPKLHPAAQDAARTDLAIIEGQMEGYQRRFDLWAKRLWDLHGLLLESESSLVRHQGREAKLTNREFQLLQFLLDHPSRWYSANQLAVRAWGDSALSPEEVRNYVRRLRKLLIELEVPAELVNRPGRGYSLVISATA